VEEATSKCITLKVDVLSGRSHIKMYNTESRRVIPENILFADASMHLSAWEFYRLAQ